MLSAGKIVDTDIIVGLSAKTGVYFFALRRGWYLFNRTGQNLETAALGYLFEGIDSFLHRDVERCLPLGVVPHHLTHKKRTEVTLGNVLVKYGS